MATRDTKAPEGLSIARNGMKFTFAWKKIDKNYDDGQELQWRTNLTNWTSITTSTSATSKTVTLTASNYYPTTAKQLTSIEFRVRGKRTYAEEDNVGIWFNWSAWSTKALTINVPKRPTLSQELSSSANNASVFTWATDTSTTDSRLAVDVEYQTILVHNCNETNGSKLKWSSTQAGWATGTWNLSGNTTKTEDSTTLASGSYTRWYRIRSRGAAGASEWRYAKHVYARPYSASIRDIGSAVSGTKTTVRVEWASTTDAAHPIDVSRLEYKFATPLSGLVCPSGSWTEGGTVNDTAGTDAVRFVIDGTVGTDQCLWVRVVNVHDRNEIPCDPKLVLVGRLATPSGLTATPNASNYTATIQYTNNSAVPDAKIAVIYGKAGEEIVVGVLSSSPGTVQCPAWGTSETVGFSIYAFQGSYTTETRSGVTIYDIDANMTSPRIGTNVNIPVAPNTFSASAGVHLDSAVIRWKWSWADATKAEISWSDDSYAWISNNQPTTSEVTDTAINKWVIRGLTPGKKYYFRIRLGNDEMWGPYTETFNVGLYSAPDKPVLQLSTATINQNDTFTASWLYASADGLPQTGAEIAAVTSVSIPESDLPKYVVIRTNTLQSANIRAAFWTKGTIYLLYVRVSSKSGLVSEWSDPVSILVADDITCTISSTSLTNKTVTDSDGVSRTVLSLASLPLTATVAGAPNGGYTTLVVTRNEDYRMARPDGLTTDGWAGETICIKRINGSGSFSIQKEDLIGRFDDGASYTLTAYTSSSFSNTAEASLDFEVHWSRQALIPLASTLEVLSGDAMKITPRVSSTSNSPTCDIYRLSADRPELIVKDGTFGTAYVDPYPAIGETAGYRVVYKTSYGDYITANNTPAWTDTMGGITSQSTLINFNGEEVALALNMDISHTWRKEFTETAYLGGSVQGDWGLTVKRSSSVSASVIRTDDQQTINALRRLALYTGICNVRTVDGSSFAADVQVNEKRSYQTAGGVAEFSLSITRVDPEGLDGMTYGEWTN